MTTGERIQRARKAAKLSQKELGDKLGVSASMIGQYENNIRNPKYDRVLQIAHILEVPPSELIADLSETLCAGIVPFITVETEDGEFIHAPKDSLEGQLLSRFQFLNEAGKKTAIERIEELVHIPKYQFKQGYIYFFEDSDESVQE